METNTKDREGGFKTWKQKRMTEREESRHDNKHEGQRREESRFGNKHEGQRGRSQDMETNTKDR